MIAFSTYAGLLSIALLITGSGAAYLGWRELEPDYAYIGTAMVGASIVAGFLALLAYFSS